LTKVPRKPLGSFSSWFGLASPAGIVDRLNHAMQQVSASAACQAGLKNLGNEPFPLTPAQGAAFIKAEVDKRAAVARSAHIQVD